MRQGLWEWGAAVELWGLCQQGWEARNARPGLCWSTLQPEMPTLNPLDGTHPCTAVVPSNVASLRAELHPMVCHPSGHR